MRAPTRSNAAASALTPAVADGYWARAAADVQRELATAPAGLSTSEARLRLARHGANAVATPTRQGLAAALLARLRDPLIGILLVAAALALVTGDWLDAAIVVVIVVVSALVSAVQERRAYTAVAALRSRVSAKAQVLRDGVVRSLPLEDVVPGDIVQLAAGSLVPADGILLEARDLFVTQGLLTGESLPVEKRPGSCPAQATLAQRSNCVFMGTSVRSGTASLLVVRTGAATAFGQIAHTLALRPPETEFERGLHRFGALLVRVMLVVVIVVFAINLLRDRPALETLLFAMALAVGISPELLPAVLGVTLARGARKMAREGVIVRQLNAIENLGSMDVLCTDKTGTITRGVLSLDSALDVDAQASADVLRLAGLNATLQTGLDNPLDAAIAQAVPSAELAGWSKLDELPYDFERKRLSVVVARDDGAPLLITKGALAQVLAVCTSVAAASAEAPLDRVWTERIQARFAQWSAQGFRVLGIACKTLERASAYGRQVESGLKFCGFLLFFDPPEPQAIRSLRALRRLGVKVKIVTGDNALVARHVAQSVGLSVRRLVTGAELAAMPDEALWHLAPRVNLFAEVDPAQKERIIRALQKSGHVVGYLGDGINDAPALQAADVGISVDQAVDVAKEAADFVLLRHDLGVLRRGIDEGRHTFANTLKYIFITSSANFGNMLSMALASLVLPFLPLLATQLLLNNFLSDIPALGIAGDNVDREWRRMPHRWNIRTVRDFMLKFGLVSSVFDALTFGALLYVLGAAPAAFRTGWFVESLLTEIAIIFVVRTYKPFWRSRPGRFVLGSALAVAGLALALPYLPGADRFGFVPLPPGVLVLIVGITAAYAAVSEMIKRRFFGRVTAKGRWRHRARAVPGA